MIIGATVSFPGNKHITYLPYLLTCIQFGPVKNTVPVIFNSVKLVFLTFYSRLAS